MKKGISVLLMWYHVTQILTTLVHTTIIKLYILFKKCNSEAFVFIILKIFQSEGKTKHVSMFSHHMVRRMVPVCVDLQNYKSTTATSYGSMLWAGQGKKVPNGPFKCIFCPVEQEIDQLEQLAQLFCLVIKNTTVEIQLLVQSFQRSSCISISDPVVSSIGSEIQYQRASWIGASRLMWQHVSKWSTKSRFIECNLTKYSLLLVLFETDQEVNNQLHTVWKTNKKSKRQQKSTQKRTFWVLCHKLYLEHQWSIKWYPEVTVLRSWMKME